MNKRPGHVTVTTEHAFCSFCGRPRNLRREEHHLGALVRTIVTCETCHRTLSSSIGVAAEPEQAPATVETPVEVEAKPAPKPRAAPAKRAPAKRAATRSTGKPSSTATRKVTKKR